MIKSELPVSVLSCFSASSVPSGKSISQIAPFDVAAYEDLDHEWLYRRDLDGFENDEDFTSYFGTGEMRVESWFEQQPNTDASVHPFTVHIPAPTLETPPQPGG